MRHNEVRTTEHDHTPSIKAGQPGRHQIPRGRDQRTNWTRAPQGTNRKGKGSNNRPGRVPTTNNKHNRQRGAHHTQKGARRPRKDTSKRAGRNTRTTKPQDGRGHARREAITQGLRQRRARRHGPSQNRTRQIAKTLTENRGATRG